MCQILVLSTYKCLQRDCLHKILLYMSTPTNINNKQLFIYNWMFNKTDLSFQLNLKQLYENIYIAQNYFYGCKIHCEYWKFHYCKIYVYCNVKHIGIAINIFTNVII